MLSSYVIGSYILSPNLLTIKPCRKSEQNFNLSVKVEIYLVFFPPFLVLTGLESVLNCEVVFSFRTGFVSIFLHYYKEIKMAICSRK